MSEVINKTFEQCVPEIEKIIEAKRSDWSFKASVMEDFDDFKQEVLVHIWEKWVQYDQSRPLGGWVATIVRHKFFNKLRDVYLTTCSPCTRCPCNMGENVCSLYGSVGDDCDLYKKWQRTKKYSHDVRLPLPIENHVDEVHSKPDTVFDIETNIKRVHERLEKELTNSQWVVYKAVFIDGKSDEEIAKELGFKSETGRKMGWKRIRQIKSIAFTTARKILQEEGIE